MTEKKCLICGKFHRSERCYESRIAAQAKEIAKLKELLGRCRPRLEVYPVPVAVYELLKAIDAALTSNPAS